MLKKAVIIIMLIIVGFWYWHFKFKPTDPLDQSAATVQTPETKTDVSALGLIMPQDGIIKIAALPEVGTSIVKKLFVRENSWIDAGDTVAILQSYDRLQSMAEEAKKKLNTAKIRLLVAKTKIESPDITAQLAVVEKLRIELESIEKNVARIENLKQQKLVSTADHDQYAYQRLEKIQELRTAQSTLDNIMETRKWDIKLREAEVAEAEATLKRAETELALATVRSPAAGTVLKIFAYEGEVVDPNEGIVELGKTDRMYVIAEVYFTDILLIKKGQEALISLDQLGLELTGEVEDVGRYIRQNKIISENPAVDADARVVEVKIRMDDSTSISGLTNMRVTCRIKI